MTLVTTLQRCLTAILANRLGAALFCVVLFSALFAEVAVAAMPQGGAPIYNRAEAIIIPHPGATPETVYSNTVQATVQNVEALTLVHDQSITLPRGSVATLPHTLTNTGNVLSSYVFTLTNSKGDNYDLNNLRLVWDVNHNGVLDDGDLPIVNGTNVSLAPGESAALLLLGQVPVSQSGGVASVLLSVKTVTNTANAANADMVMVSGMAVMSIVKKADKVGTVQAGQTVRYSLIANNISNQDALPATGPNASATTIRVDGVSKPLILIHDSIPVGTEFAGGLSASNPNVLKLYRLKGAMPFDYQSSYTDPAHVAEVAIGLETSVPASGSELMAFDVNVVTTNTPTQITNTGFVAFNNSVDNVDSPSNPVVLNLSMPKLSIGIAKAAGAITANVDTNGQSDGSYTAPFMFTVQNYGEAPLYDIKVNDLLEGSDKFGSYVQAAIPGKGQYTVVAGSGAVTSASSGTAVGFNNGFTGQAGQQDMVAPNAVLPVGGSFTVQFKLRWFPANVKSFIVNTATATATATPGGVAVVTDDSVNGGNPDADGNGDPSDSSATPVDTSAVTPNAPTLAMEKTVGPPHKLSMTGYEVDYTIKVRNNGNIDATFVRVADNLDCTFEMDHINGPFDSWELQGPPVMQNGLLVSAGAAYKGYISRNGTRGVCDRSQLEENNPAAGFPDQQQLNLTDGSRSLKPGEEEVITFSVRVERNPATFRNLQVFSNKAFGAVFDSNNVNGATLVVAAAAADTGMLIDPQGVVYDATDPTKLIAGAKVSLIREQCTGGLPPDFTLDQLVQGNSGIYTTENGNTVSMVTGADGNYFFVLKSPPVTQDCDYSLNVVAPNGYTFQSKIAPQSGVSPAGFVQPQDGPPADPATAPYYLKFRLGPNEGSVFHNHIPLDPAAGAGGQLFLKKLASKAVVELVDFVDYTLTLTNQTSAPITGYSIIDTLPAGFAYEPGSTVVDDLRVADPEGGRGPVVTWSDPNKTIPVGGTVELSYRVRVGIGAAQGDGINHAVATSGVLRSQEAMARVQINGGVFSDEGYIIGKVYMDCNGDRLQGHEEIGVPGVRVLLEDGTYAVSDVEGKYSFYGIKPVTHVLKLDTMTLPRGAKLLPLSNRNSGKGDSQFVDLKKGELHKADFAVFNGDTDAEKASCNKSPLFEEVKHRREAITARPDAEANYALRTRMDPQGRSLLLADPRGLPASGLVGQTTTGVVGGQKNGDAQAFTSVMPRDLNVVRPMSLPDTAPVAPLPMVKMEDQIVNLDNSLDFIDLKDKDTLPIDQANVRIKGTMGASFRLTVNGNEVGEQRVGKRSKIADKQLEAWEYIGVGLKPGSNTLKLEQFDDSGNQRGEKSITLIAPDALGKLELDLPAIAIADGATPVHMKLRLTDKNGIPVSVRTQVTLETDQGRWETKDLNQSEPGTQIFVQGGVADVVLIPPNQPSDGIIRLSSGMIKREVKIAYLPELRPLVGAGILEGVLNLRRLGTGNLSSANPNQAFEKELSSFSNSNDKDVKATGRAAFYFKGSVLGKYLLTTAYDSDKGTRERLFRDIQPDQYYPIYGDSATKGFDAQSTSRMYVRLDKNKSYLLYGDFTTTGNTDVRQLTQYSRSLTGVKGHYEDNLFNITGFYSQSGSTQVVEEFPANGTSGPYILGNGGNVLENSEKVEVLVRDRNQPSIVLASTTMSRFVDYSLEPLTKRLLFRGPVPSVDANLNRQYIRVTYETGANGVGGQGGGPLFGIGGVDAQVKVTDNVQLGAIGIKDENPANQSTLLGATAVVKLAEKTVINGEFGQSKTDLKGEGYAERVELNHEDGDLKAKVKFTKTDKGFSNQSAYSLSGRTEAPATIEYKLTQDTKLKAEGLYSKDDVNGGIRKGVLGKVVHHLNDTMDVELGMRASVDTGVLGGGNCVSNLTYTTSNCAPTALTSLGHGARNELLTVRSKFITQIPWVTGLQGYLEAEQDVREMKKHLFAVGSNYQLTEKTRLFGRYELASTLGSQFNLNSFAPNNTAVLGIESAYMKGGNMYNEYRLRDTMSGREAQTALGVRNTWTISEGLKVGGGFETTKSFNGLPGSNSNALVGSVEYFANPRYRTSASLELRKADISDSLLNTLALSYKLSKEWSFLGRNVFSYSDNKSAGTTMLTRQQLGFAYREVDENVWNLLARYEHKYQDISGSPADVSTRTHIISANANYQANADVIISGRYAGKIMTNDQALADKSMLDSMYWAQLLYGRATWDFIKDWDASLQTGVYFGKGGATQYAAGTEIGYQVVDNLWLSAGYNFLGVSDPDLAANDYLNSGPYVRARFKFDENSFFW